MKNKDNKTIAIVVLGLGFILMSALYIHEKISPDALTTLRNACKDTSTETQRDLCIGSLQEIQNVIDRMETGQ